MFSSKEDHAKSAQHKLHIPLSQSYISILCFLYIEKDAICWFWPKILRLCQELSSLCLKKTKKSHMLFLEVVSQRTSSSLRQELISFLIFEKIQPLPPIQLVVVVSRWCMGNSIITGLSQHKSREDVHGNRQDCDSVKSWKSLRKPLWRFESGKLRHFRSRNPQITPKLFKSNHEASLLRLVTVTLHNKLEIFFKTCESGIL